MTRRRLAGLRSRLSFLVTPRLLVTLLVLIILAGYWLLPIRGQVLILPDAQQTHLGTWPQVWAEPPAARPGEEVTLYVRDNAPWPHVKLLVDGIPAQRDESYPAGNGPWTWRWQLRRPEQAGYDAIFYHDCDTGCVERARVHLGSRPLPATPAPAPAPTKLGVVFADFGRNWHGRAGWTVELTYAERQGDVDFSIDGLAQRVHRANRSGLRVLVRVAYDRQQALPPTDDEIALARYLAYCARLARDDRLRDVYGYIIGSGYNGRDENRLSPNNPTTPEWYARIFNGYAIAEQRSDNVVQMMRAANPGARVLVGPVSPWNTDQNGAIRDPLNQPWLNYFNTVVAYLDTTAQLKGAAGIPLAAPDGFALTTPGRVTAVAVAGQPAREPATDVRQPEWGAAQAGFRIYQNWLAIINRHTATRGLPAYITSTNTFTPDGTAPPAQTYPRGWLAIALNEINREPQILALCWFADASLGDRWNEFSLQKRLGRMHDAAEEFERLLQQQDAPATPHTASQSHPPAHRSLRQTGSGD